MGKSKIDRGALTEKIKRDTGIDISKNLRIKIVDCSNNPLVKDSEYYKIYYTDKATNKRCKFAYFESVGMQYLK